MEQFNNLTLEEKSYIYGFLLTDGNVYFKNTDIYDGQISLEISKRDEDIIDKICGLLVSGRKSERTRKTNFKEDCCSVRFRSCNRQLLKDLIDFGFPVSNKTLNAHPPLVEYDKNAFWRGVIDGDGAIGVAKNEKTNGQPFLTLATKSELLKNEFCKYLSEITNKKYNPNLSKRDNIYNISCGNHSCCSVLRMLYKNATIYLDRKYKKYLDCLKWEENSKKNKLRSSNTSGVEGVSFRKKSDKWMAYIRINGERKYLGTFDNKKDAIRARLKSEKEYYGELAKQARLFEEYNII